MLNRFNYILIIAVIALLGASSYLVNRNKALREENSKYRGNTNALLSDIKRFRMDSVSTAVDVEVLRLTVGEYKKYRAEDLETIKKMKVRINDLQMAAKHEIEVNVPVVTELRDTVVRVDSVLVGVKKIEMDTPYLKIDGLIRENRLTGDIRIPVVLNQAVWIEKKYRFLWWRWGVKAIHQTISSNNPYVEVIYSECIMIE